VRFPPAHSPDLHPIEVAAGKTDAARRKGAKRTTKDLRRSIEEGVKSLAPDARFALFVGIVLALPKNDAGSLIGIVKACRVGAHFRECACIG